MKITTNVEFLELLSKPLESLGHKVSVNDEEADMYIGYPNKTIHQENYPNLKYIQLASSGYDSLDMEQLRRQDVSIANAKGVYSDSIAEYVLTYILYILKDVNQLKEMQESKVWDKKVLSPKSLMTQNVFILGTGSISQEIAKRLQAFSSTITGFNSDGRLIEYFPNCDALSNLKDRLSEADIVISALPDNEYTKHLFNKETFTLMKEDSILINVGRGSLIDESSIKTHALHLNRIVMDVFEKEPLEKENNIWEMPNVIVTPHMSFISAQNGQNLLKLVLENLENIKNKQSLTNKIL